MKKRFGQNFMVNPAARSSIVQLLPNDPNLIVWEIGPGIGAITGMLIQKYGKLKVFEIDHGFIRILKEEFPDDIDIIEGDALKTWLPQKEAFGVPDALVGNLPYSSGSVMIGDFLENQFLPGTMVFTLQKEVVKRMVSAPGKKEYSSFSVLCQAYYNVEYCGDLGSGSFYPPPEVTSAVVRLVRKEGDLILPNPEIFTLILRGAFVARRKTLLNNYKALSTQVASRPIGHVLTLVNLQLAAEQVGMDLSRRAEEYPSTVFVQLARVITTLE